MAEFAIRNLSVLAYAQGFTLWHFKHPAPLAEALEPGFFNGAGKTALQNDTMLAVGDHIHVSAGKEGALLAVLEVPAWPGNVVVEMMCGTARAVR